MQENEIIKAARMIRSFIEAQSQNVSDDEALEIPAAFPRWNGNETLYKQGDRVLFDGVLYKCLQSHTALPGWEPSVAVSLWGQVLSSQETGTVDEWVQPGSTNPYMTGDRVLFNGKTYESVIDNNVWSPADYPAGWKEI